MRAAANAICIHGDLVKEISRGVRYGGPTDAHVQVDRISRPMVGAMWSPEGPFYVQAALLSARTDSAGYILTSHDAHLVHVARPEIGSEGAAQKFREVEALRHR